MREKGNGPLDPPSDEFGNHIWSRYPWLMRLDSCSDERKDLLMKVDIPWSKQERKVKVSTRVIRHQKSWLTIAAIFFNFPRMKNDVKRVTYVILARSC